MSYREKENIVNILSALLITSIFWFNIYQRHLDGQFNLTQDFASWGKIFLIFMGVSIAARIIIYIIFHIINSIATREDKIPVEDERDKLIQLKATRNSHYAFSFSFMGSFILLATGMPVQGFFICFLVGGILSEIVDNVSQLIYHRKGI